MCVPLTVSSSHQRERLSALESPPAGRTSYRRPTSQVACSINWCEASRADARPCRLRHTRALLGAPRREWCGAVRVVELIKREGYDVEVEGLDSHESEIAEAIEEVHQENFDLWV